MSDPVRVLTPPEFAPFLRGALHAELKPDCLEPARLPQSALAQSPDPGLTLMARMTSGMRLAFETNSPFVVLDVLETGFRLTGEPRRPSTFDVTAEGALVARAHTSSGPTIAAYITKIPPAVKIEPGEPSVVRFDIAAARDRPIASAHRHGTASRPAHCERS
jgi:hypothetical protein